MWFLVTDDDRLVTERELFWPELAENIRIRELIYVPRDGRGFKIRDCEFFGFQRYRLDAPEGQVGQGAQLIGVKGNQAIIIEVNEDTGERRQWTVPRDQLTYDQKLLRHGMG